MIGGIFICTLVFFIYLSAGVNFMVNDWMDREGEWDTKQGWIINFIITLFWPLIGVAVTVYFILIGIIQIPKALYEWWSSKPDK